MVIQKKDGSKYDITNITESVTTSGDIKQCGRKCEFSTIRSSGFNIANGDMAKFYDEEEEVFRGTILSIDKNSSSDTFKYTALDEGWRLTKSKGSFNFSIRCTFCLVIANIYFFLLVLASSVYSVMIIS